MAQFKDVIEVTIPDFTDEELDKIVAKHDVDEVMRAFGYEKKEKRMSLTKYMINLPTQLMDESGYPSDRLALYTETNTIGIVQQDETEAFESADDWGFSLFFDEDTKNKLQEKFNGSLVITEVKI